MENNSTFQISMQKLYEVANGAIRTDNSYRRHCKNVHKVEFTEVKESEGEGRFMCYNTSCDLKSKI